MKVSLIFSIDSCLASTTSGPLFLLASPHISDLLLAAHSYYFDEPEIFRPERYLNNPHGTKKGMNITGFCDNLPFGTGRVGLITYISLIYTMHLKMVSNSF